MGGPTTWQQATGVPPLQPPKAMIRLGANPGPAPASQGASTLAEYQRRDARIAELERQAVGLRTELEYARLQLEDVRAALADLYRLGQAQILLTPEREEILHRAERALASTTPPVGA